MINMVRAGETGGFLDSALESVANNFETEVKLRGKIKSAMTYPVVVLVIAIVAVVGMLIFIVPVFEKMFKQTGREPAAAHPVPGGPLARDGVHRPGRWSILRHRLRDLVEEEQERRGGAARRRPAAS